MIATQAADVVVRNALDNDSDVGNRYSTQTLRYTRYCWRATKTATDRLPTLTPDGELVSYSHLVDEQCWMCVGGFQRVCAGAYRW